jgi:hypothetical protein
VIPVLEGVTLHPKVQDNNVRLSGNDAWPARSDVSICTRGSLGAYVEVAVTPDDKVFWRHTASGGNTVLGAFRNDSDGGTAIEAKGLRFNTSASAGGAAELEVISIR